MSGLTHQEAVLGLLIILTCHLICGTKYNHEKDLNPVIMLCLGFYYRKFAVCNLNYNCTDTITSVYSSL